MLKLEIIQEFENEYVKHPVRRAVRLKHPLRSIEGCDYWNQETNKKCAVGRCFTDEALKSCGESGDLVHNLDISYGLDSLLQEKYRGHDISFWQDLQNLHDHTHYWHSENKGMTKLGMKKLSELKNYWGDKET